MKYQPFQRSFKGLIEMFYREVPNWPDSQKLCPVIGLTWLILVIDLSFQMKELSSSIANSNLAPGGALLSGWSNVFI